jgi:hypothetical protein
VRNHTIRLSGSSGKILLGLGIISFLLYDHRPADITPEEAALGLLIVWLGFLPIFLFLRGYGSGPLPLMPAVGLFYCVAFGLAVFVNFSPLRDISWMSEKSTSALTTVVLGLISLYVLYYLSWGVCQRNSAFSLHIADHGASLSAILWACIAVHLTDLYLHFSVDVPSVGHLLDAASLVGYGCLTWQLFERRLPSLQRASLLVVALPLELVSRITSGSLAQPMQLGLLIAFVYWLVRQKLPWMTIFVAGLILLELHNVKHKYRDLYWYGAGSSDSEVTRLETFFRLAFEKSADSEPSEGGLLGNSLTVRASQLGFLTHVMEQTPVIVPYWKGETYKILLSKFIPRLFWPDKPTETMGQEFSSRYGMRDIHDETTSFNVPWIVEMYANFGTVGVIVGMAFVGILFAFLDRKFNRTEMLMLDRVVGTVLVFDLIYQESNFSLMVGNKLLTYVAIRFLFQAFLKSRKPGRSRSAVISPGSQCRLRASAAPSAQKHVREGAGANAN